MIDHKYFNERIARCYKFKQKEIQLDELRMLVEELANGYQYCIEILEGHIEHSIDRLSEKQREKLGYFSVEDVTRDIDVRVGS